MTIQQIKDQIRLEDLIGETMTVEGRGRLLTTKEHDSLKIRTDWQRWFWYSKGDAQGDIFDWYMLQHNCDFRTALEDLGRKAGVEPAPLSPTQQQAQDERRRREAVLRMAAAYYHTALMAHPDAEPARRYCYEERRWTDVTVAREQIGYVLPTGNNALSVEGLQPLHARLRDVGLMDHPAAKAVLSIPAGMLVYVHRERGQVVYLSGRSIEGKRHYNLPEELAGSKQPYVNDPETVKGGAHVLVEGQADAISLAQLGIQATAVCGLSDLDVKVSHVAFDNDKAGKAKALETALNIDPLCRIVTWPKTLRHRDENHNHVEIKDAADLLKANPDEVDVMTWLEESPQAMQELAAVAGKARDEERKELLDRFFQLYCGLDEMVATDLKPDLATRLCGGLGQFNRLLKAHEKMSGDEHDSPERYEYSAGGAKGGIVWEQIIAWRPDGSGQAAYAVRDTDGKIETKTSVGVGATTYLPYAAETELIEADVVLFPEKPVDYGTEKTLVKDVQQFIHRYLDIDPFYEKLAAYYVLFTWLYDLFENLPYLRALGDYGTGKTRFIQVIGAACYRPMFVSGASTTSPVFTMMDIFKGTLVIDEADFGNSDADAEIIKILNVGYYKKGVVLRSKKDPNSASDDFLPSAKKVFGPKILATRRTFTDRATESRCLTKRMTTARPRPGIPYTLGSDFWREATDLRNKLLMYRLKNYRPIEIDQGLADESVEPRLNQVTLALKTIITDEAMRAEIDTFIRAYNETMINDRQMSLAAVVVQVLVDLHHTEKVDVLGQDARDFSMQGLAHTVQSVMVDIDPDFKISARKVGKVLSEELGLVGRHTDPYSRRSILKYEEDELYSLMSRYGIKPLLQQK